MPLEFSFAEFIEEIEAIRTMTAQFVALESHHVLHDLRDQLEVLRSSRTAAEVKWEIFERSPLKTRVSHGEYERGRGGGHRVFAEITSVWAISGLRQGLKNSQPTSTFALTGVASTHVRLRELLDGAQRELAMWRVEVASDDSPGCHFHVQILGKTPNLPFPSTLSVPRLPSCIITPMAVLEFVLAELFQDEWNQYAVGDKNDIRLWRRIQQRRLERLFDWQARAVKDCVGAPWTALKLKRPDRRLFI